MQHDDWSPLLWLPERNLAGEPAEVNRMDLRAAHAGRRRNGMPEPLVRQRRRGDSERDEQVAAMVAAAKAEALRRARAWLGPGPLQRRVTNGTRAAWEPCEDEGEPA